MRGRGCSLGARPGADGRLPIVGGLWARLQTCRAGPAECHFRSLQQLAGRVGTGSLEGRQGDVEPAGQPACHHRGGSWLLSGPAPPQWPRQQGTSVVPATPQVLSDILQGTRDKPCR